MRKLQLLLIIISITIMPVCGEETEESAIKFVGSQWCGTSDSGDEQVLSFISENKIVIEYLDSDTFSEQGEYIWNAQLKKGIVTIDDEEITLTMDDKYGVLRFVDSEERIFTIIKNNKLLDLKNTIWLGIDAGEISKIEFRTKNQFVLTEFDHPENELTGVYRWNNYEGEGVINTYKELKIDLSKTGNLLRIYVPQVSGNIAQYGFIRVK